MLELWQTKDIITQVKDKKIKVTKQAEDSLPDVPRQMLAPGKAQLARRELGAEETLSLLLLICHCPGIVAAITRRTRVLAFRTIHIHIYRVS